jgi:Rps23 Pro-64 3,4-dihydroxylase Tpa1-like proline 4-hydroxylase
MSFLDIPLQELPLLGKEKHAAYAGANPFPSIWFDDFFNAETLRQVMSEFPELGKDGKDEVFYANPNEAKYASKGEYKFGPLTRQFMHFLNSQPFLEFLQNLTGIQETLIPDPYFEGGGYHQIKPGGFLKVHVDFHKHKAMNLDRRVNVLVYLNEDWEEAYGGHFELWDRDMSHCVTRIAPLFNRMAIFSTTDFSWHGHPDPLTCPPDRSRRSLALYYYTNGRPASEVSEANRKRITTTFAARKGQDSARMTVFNSLVNLANDLLPPIVVKAIKKFRKN